MKLLAFDTSTAQGSVAVIEGDFVSGSSPRLLSERNWRREKSHSEFLTAEIQEALKDAHLSIHDIDIFAVGKGPGSFTGLRVAINAARSFAYALGKDVFTFETPSILAEAVSRHDLPLLVVLNAQKNSFFVARFEWHGEEWRASGPIEILSIDELGLRLTAPHVCLGDGCADAEPRLKPEHKLKWVRDSHVDDYPRAISLGKLVFSHCQRPTPLVWNALQPLYLKASGAEEKLREDSKS